MKTVRIRVFFISLLGGLHRGHGQQEEVLPSIVADNLEVKEKIPLTLRFGADLSRIIRSQTSDDFNGFEAVADLRVGEKFFLALELGNVETTQQVELLFLVERQKFLMSLPTKVYFLVEKSS